MKSLRILIALAVALSAVYLLYRSFIYSPIIFAVRDDYKEAIPFQAAPDGVAGISAEDCGVCHREIYEEWKSSYHAKAFTDPFFQAFWRKDEQIWVCLNCHTPVVNQQPFLINGLKGGSVSRPIKEPNPDFDRDLQGEGVTCAACHLRDGVILGPYKDSLAPHPTRFDPRFLTTEICYTCHQVPGGPFQFYNGAPCSTHFEFEGNPWAEKGYVCQSCHMPEVTRAAATGGAVRKGRRHLWQGGHSPEMVKRALRGELTSDKALYAPGETARFSLKLTNSGAGHKVPTGDPDRFFTISFKVVNNEGRVLKEKTHTIGRWIIWKPVIVELYGNRVPPLESRDYTFEYRVPRNGKVELRLAVEVRYHIMTERTHAKLKEKYGLTGSDPISFVVYEYERPLNYERSLAAEKP